MVNHSTNFRDGVGDFFGVEEVEYILGSYGLPDTLAHRMTCSDQSLVIANKDNGVRIKELAGKYGHKPAKQAQTKKKK